MSAYEPPKDNLVIFHSSTFKEANTGTNTTPYVTQPINKTSLDTENKILKSQLSDLQERLKRIEDKVLL
jgi:hypothetical protein